MPAAAQITEHPHIVRTPGTCGGRARIQGTRIAVWEVVAAVVHRGLVPEELIEQLPHLSLAQVHDALSFYYDHRAEVERDRRDQDAAWRGRARRS